MLKASVDRALRISLLVFFVLSFIPIQVGHVSASGTLQQQSATELLQEMTPEERVGQLFLVTFNGNEIYETDLIYELVSQHYISGVILRADHNNFIALPDTLPRLKALTERLQIARYNASQDARIPDPVSGELTQAAYIPLLIGVSQEGNGAPYSQIHEGLSLTPSQMAIGATWDPGLARSVGELLGSELSLMGINLLLGPSLDVLEDPRLAGPGDIGVRSFGGDPYWVSLMGKAYIEGVHQGSQGRVGVIAKHFPGLGGADRPPEDEITTVRKSLAELEQIDLVPFFSVAQVAPGEEEYIADGFLSSNTRYQGFQGNIRATTRPVSLDREAYDQLLSLEGLVNWHEGGGLTMSDSLGSRAIRRFIESLGQSYKGHLVAKDAFLAGNDLLLLDEIKSDTDEDEATTIKATLAFFAQKYVEDTVFAQRVDEAVLKILGFKLRLYNNHFDFETVIPQESYLGTVGENTELIAEIARNSATLISPSQIEVEDRIGSPPIVDERIIFITDSRVFRQCSTCAPRVDIPVNAFESVVTRLYGQAASGQIGDWNLSSFTMGDLENYLGNLPTEIPPVPLAEVDVFEESLFSADWIIFTILGSSDDVYGSNALKTLLDSRQELVLDKRVVVFAMDVPYELDSTDISKIDLYYSLYSKSSPFIEYAARLLFQEATADGHSPVSIPGIGYDLIDITSPNPEQLIGFYVAINGEGISAEGEVDNPQVGDMIEIQTEGILDKNGNQVPDGTPVDFIFTYQNENIPPLLLSTTTVGGVARISEVLDRAGTVEISVESVSARNSDVLVINVLGDEEAQGTGTPQAEGEVTQVTPTEVEEEEPVSTETASGAEPEGESGEEHIDLDDLFLALVATTITGGVAFLLSSLFPGAILLRLRFVVVSIVGSLIGYDYLALGLPGSSMLFEALGRAAGVIFSIVGGGAALGIFLVWWRRKGGR